MRRRGERNEHRSRTSIEAFRNAVGKQGTQDPNRLFVQAAAVAGFTDSTICSADTTVQEAPIQYPTEAGHMKKIAEKLRAFAKHF